MFLAVVSSSSGSYRVGRASKRMSCCFRDTRTFYRCDNTRNWITTGLDNRYGCITAHRSLSEHDLVTASQVFCKKHIVMPESVLIIASWTMFSFFHIAALLTRATTWKQSYASDAIGTLNSYGIISLAWLSSSTNCRSSVPLSNVTTKFLVRKRCQKSSRVRPPLLCIHTNGQKWSESLANLLNSELAERHVLFFRNWASFSADILRETLNSIFLMFSLAAGTVAIAFHCKKDLTGCPSKLDFALKAVASTNSRKEFSMPRRMVTLLIVIESEVRNKINRKEKDERE